MYHFCLLSIISFKLNIIELYAESIDVWYIGMESTEVMLAFQGCSIPMLLKLADFRFFPFYF